MSRPKFLDVLMTISIGWGIFLNVSVVLGLQFVLTLAAGGNFVEFPTAIRVVYFFQTLLLIFQLYIYLKSANGNKLKRNWILLLFAVLDVLGFCMNAFSTSANERWNAIPLAIGAYAFWVQYKKQKALN
jgi:hypothetical protein